EEVTGKLAGLAGIEFATEDSFLNALKLAIGEADTAFYSPVIFKAARGEKPLTAREYEYEDNSDQLKTVTHTDWIETVDDTDPDNPVSVRTPVTKNLSFTYDDNGSMVTKTDSLNPSDSLTLDYDARNRMVRAVKNGTEAGLYDYNAHGMKVRHYAGGRGDIDYFYDGSSVIEERNADGTLLAHYRYADRLFRLDTQTYSQYYHHDALGSTVNLTDIDGSAEVSYRLDLWGKIREQTGTTVNRQIFTGQEYDENTGLTDFGARLYDPDIARFVSQDAYLGEAGIPPSLHRYLYAYSNPTVYTDLLGYESLSLYYMNKVDENLAKGNIWTAGLWYVGMSFHNDLTFSFLASHDPWYDRYERGEIESLQYTGRLGHAFVKSFAIGAVTVGTGASTGSVTSRLLTKSGAGTTLSLLGSGTAAGTTAATSGLLVSDGFDAIGGGEFHSPEDYAVTAACGAAFGFTTSGIAAVHQSYANYRTFEKCNYPGEWAQPTVEVMLKYEAAWAGRKINPLATPLLKKGYPGKPFYEKGKTSNEAPFSDWDQTLRSKWTLKGYDKDVLDKKLESIRVLREEAMSRGRMEVREQDGILVMSDPKTGKPFVADADPAFMFFKKDSSLDLLNRTPMNTRFRGTLTFAEEFIRRKSNIAISKKGGYTGGDAMKHGPDSRNPGAEYLPESDFPMPSIDSSLPWWSRGRVQMINNHAELKTIIRNMQKRGYRGTYTEKWWNR
ncbi:MAG: hypothetical protein GY795_20750, partial [Desulfobacterales bacterium]|nr:hypothetical protein [Desulfobacterales bacterium]